MESESDSRQEAIDAQLRLALYQPDIPQNTGTMLRMAACLGIAIDIIEPAGFPVSDRAFRRAGMDYLDRLSVERHLSYRHFMNGMRAAGRRPVLLTTKASMPHLAFRFRPGDVLMVGRESAGVPDHVHDEIENRIVVPMRADLRSLNVAIAASIVCGEALRQLGLFAPAGEDHVWTDFPGPNFSRAALP